MLLRRFPRLTAAKVFDALAFAYDNEEVVSADIRREEQLLQRAARSAGAEARRLRQMALPFSGGSSAEREP